VNLVTKTQIKGDKNTKSRNVILL